jgi:predicted glutamine amidotransferase
MAAREDRAMCRWLAYSGDPIPIEWLVLQPTNSLVDQSLHSRMGATTTNGDGFGVGWYDGVNERPGVYRSVHPAWNDRNLRELVEHVSSPYFFAHIRASTGTAVQETNTHPFRYGRWLFMHNGVVREFPRIRRDLMLAIAPELIPALEGSTDSEVLFLLALTFGLEQDAVTALERMAGFVEETGHRHGVAAPLQMTVGLSDGERVYAARYASGPVVNSLFVTADASAVRALYPEDERFREFGDEARAIVSEPLGDLPGVWHEVAAGSALVVQAGPDEQVPFTPRKPG